MQTQTSVPPSLRAGCLWHDSSLGCWLECTPASSCYIHARYCIFVAKSLVRVHMAKFSMRDSYIQHAKCCIHHSECKMSTSNPALARCWAAFGTGRGFASSVLRARLRASRLRLRCCSGRSTDLWLPWRRSHGERVLAYYGDGCVGRCLEVGGGVWCML